MGNHPATFHGTMFIVEHGGSGDRPTFGAEGARLTGLDQFGGTFQCEIEMTLDRLLGLGCVPVAPSHPDHHLYLAAVAAHEADLLRPQEPLHVPRLDAPGVMSMPFATEFDLEPAAWRRLGLRSPHEQAEAARAAEEAAKAPPPRPTPRPPPAAPAARSIGGCGVPLPPPRRDDRTPRQQAADKAALQEIAAGWRAQAQARAGAQASHADRLALQAKAYAARRSPAAEGEVHDETFESLKANGRLDAIGQRAGSSALKRAIATQGPVAASRALSAKAKGDPSLSGATPAVEARDPEGKLVSPERDAVQPVYPIEMAIGIAAAGAEGGVYAVVRTVGGLIARRLAQGMPPRLQETPVPQPKQELPTNSEPSAANRADFEKYTDVLRRAMEKPLVQDGELDRIVKESYRENADIGSGSTAAAVSLNGLRSRKSRRDRIPSRPNRQ